MDEPDPEPIQEGQEDPVLEAQFEHILDVQERESENPEEPDQPAYLQLVKFAAQQELPIPAPPSLIQPTVQVSPTGRSVLLISLGFVTFGLFRSLEALLNVEACVASSRVGEFWVDELTEDVIRSRSGGLFWHERVHQ